MPAILLVDDDAQAVKSLKRALEASGLEGDLLLAENHEVAASLAQEYRPQVAVVDLCLEESLGIESGMRLLKELLVADPTARYIVLTGHGTTDVGVRCLRAGAASFLEKPASIPHLLALIEDGVRQCELRRSSEREARSDRSALSALMVAHAPAMREVVDSALRAARTAQSVLICGETGTGKGVLAKAIHALSSRAKQPFVRYQPVNDSLDLITRDLFGSVRGAYTGAVKDTRGLLGKAHKGTFFLDEIDSLPHQAQVALLGVLQEKRYRPTGSEEESESDFRLIAATNCPIEEALASKKLRSDLYQRIANVTIHLPPLRERLDDVPAFAERILARLQETENLAVYEVDEEALQLLMQYRYPGNVRELEAIIEDAAYRASFSGRSAIVLDDVRSRLGVEAGTEPIGASQPPVEGQPGASLTVLLETYRRKVLQDALARHGGNISAVSRELQVDRKSIRRFLGS